MKAKYLLPAFVAIGFASANAAVVNGTAYDFSAAPAPSGAVLVDGTLATAGLINANVGFFTAGFDPTANLGDIPALITNFNIVASADVGNTMGSFGEDHPGLFDTGNGPLAAAPGDPAIGQTLYTFYGTGAALAPGGLGYGLVDSGVSVIVDTFPPETYVLSPAGGTILIGESVTATGINAPALGIADASAPGINIVTIPEPSALRLGLVGFVGILRRRR
jgi:hypothetical protein